MLVDWKAAIYKRELSVKASILADAFSQQRIMYRLEMILNRGSILL